MQPGAQPWLKVDLLQHDTGGNQVIKDIIRRRMQRHAGDNIEGTEQADEAGFTLIELMVVVLIIAILAAVAIPTFLGARSRAQHSAAVQNLVNATTAAQTIYATDNSSYAPGQTCTAPTTVVTLSDNTFGCELQKGEPSLQFTEAATVKATPDMVSLGVGTAGNATGNVQSIMMADYDSAGRCDYVLEIGSSASAAIQATGTPDSAGTWYADQAATTGTCTVIKTGAPASGSDAAYDTSLLTKLTWSKTPPAS